MGKSVKITNEFFTDINRKKNLLRADFKKEYNYVNIVYIFKHYNLKNISKSSSYKTASSLLYIFVI